MNGISFFSYFLMLIAIGFEGFGVGYPEMYKLQYSGISIGIVAICGPDNACEPFTDSACKCFMHHNFHMLSK